MKLRMLNGAHTAIAAIGQITGLPTVASTYADARVRRFIDLYWQQVDPTLSPLVDGPSYVTGLRSRFANPALKHKAVQIASDASQKVPQRILAPLLELRAENRPSDAVALALALWIRSCAGTDEQGAAIVVNDPAFNDWPAPDQATLPPEQIVAAFLRFDRVFGADRAADTDFAAALTAAYRSIIDHGVFGALDRIA